MDTTTWIMLMGTGMVIVLVLMAVVTAGDVRKDRESRSRPRDDKRDGPSA